MDFFPIFLLICYKKEYPYNGIYENNMVSGDLRNKNYNIIQTFSIKSKF